MKAPNLNILKIIRTLTLASVLLSLLPALTLTASSSASSLPVYLNQGDVLISTTTNFMSSTISVATTTTLLENETTLSKQTTTPKQIINTAFVSADQPDPNPTNNTATVTVTVKSPLLALYILAFDNRLDSPVNLTHYYTQTIEAIRQATLTDSQKIAIILYDLDRNGDTGILTIQQGQITPISGLPTLSGTLTLTTTLAEYNTADGEQLGRFIKWARNQYPSTPQTLFTYIGHGTYHMPKTAMTSIFSLTQPILLKSTSDYIPPLPTQTGANPDFTDMDPPAIITPPDLATALAIGNQGHPKLTTADLLHCFSGSIDALYQIAPHVQTIVSGPNYTYFSPYAIKQILRNVQPSLTATQLATNIAATHHQSLGSTASQHPGLTIAVDSEAILSLKPTWDTFTTALYQNFNRTNLETAYQNSGSYDTTFCKPQDWALQSPDILLDLGLFIKQVGSAYQPNSSVRNTANQVTTQISQTIIAAYQRNGIPWFAAPLTPTWNFEGYTGISLLAPFHKATTALPFQAAWYTHTIHTPYQLISPTNPSTFTWADVIHRYWPTNTYTTTACLPHFPTAQPISLHISSPPPAQLRQPITVPIHIKNVIKEDGVQNIQFTLQVSNPTILIPHPTLTPQLGDFSALNLSTTRLTAGWQVNLTVPISITEVINGDGIIAHLPFIAQNKGCSGLYLNNYHLSTSGLTPVAIQTHPAKACTEVGTLTGLVYLEHRSLATANHGGIKITLTNGQELTYTTQTNSQGNFTLPRIATGSYTITFKHPLFIKAIRLITITTNQTATITAGLWAGDIDQNGNVDEADWLIINSAMPPVNDLRYDIDDNGRVNGQDRKYIINNLNRPNMATTNPPPTARLAQETRPTFKQQRLSADGIAIIPQGDNKATLQLTQSFSTPLYALGLALTIPTHLKVEAIDWLQPHPPTFISGHQTDNIFYLIIVTYPNPISPTLNLVQLTFKHIFKGGDVNDQINNTQLKAANLLTTAWPPRVYLPLILK